MPPRKRKSGVADVVETPAKRTRRSTADPATPKTAAALTVSKHLRDASIITLQFRLRSQYEVHHDWVKPVIYLSH